MSNCKQLTLAILLACAAPAYAQDADELARKLSNPVAAMISVPFQYNYDEAIGPAEGHRHLLNIQPVIPASIGENWNLISPSSCRCWRRTMSSGRPAASLAWAMWSPASSSRRRSPPPAA